MVSKRSREQFKKTVWDFYHANRRDFPWRKNITPYRVLVSEIMLQQTQVARGEVKYKEFLKIFPSFRALAQASNADVLAAWQGLGYNRRALYLKKTAEAVVEKYNGRLPSDPAQLITLPGIGAYTAGAVCAFAFNKPVVFIDTNVRRTYIHHFFNDRNGVDDAELMPLVEATLDGERAREWYSALMDYGSMLGTKKENANKRSAHYVKQSRFEGSVRQARGKILTALTGTKRHATWEELGRVLGKSDEHIRAAVDGLEKDGLVRFVRGRIALAE